MNIYWNPCTCRFVFAQKEQDQWPVRHQHFSFPTFTKRFKFKFWAWATDAFVWLTGYKKNPRTSSFQQMEGVRDACIARVFLAGLFTGCGHDWRRNPALLAFVSAKCTCVSSTTFRNTFPWFPWIPITKRHMDTCFDLENSSPRQEGRPFGSFLD